MDDADLKALLMAGAPPASDPRFVLAVMTRIEQRRFRRELAMILGLGACAMALLVLMAPSLQMVWDHVPQTSNLAIALVLMAVTLVMPQIFPSRD
ncbi:MAG: hypothetical protein H0U98_00605 [Alphaproteobacteria bacterium]|nr:hypothetical protein [Alphaproteobacteria bacterium]